MKDEHWIEELRGLMADYEEPAPEGLWPRIESALADEGALPVSRGWAWLRYAVSVAAVLLIALLAGTGGFFDERLPQEASGWRFPVRHEFGAVADVAMVGSHRDAVTTDPAVAVAFDADTVGNVSESENPGGRSVGYNGYDDAGMPAQSEDESTLPSVGKPEKEADMFIPPYADSEPLANIVELGGDRQHGRLSAGLYASNLTRTSERSEGYGGFVAGYSAAPNVVGLEALPEAENYLCEMLRYNSVIPVETRIKHHQPVKVGLSLSYSLSRRLSIGSGLTYSYLVSTASSGSEHYSCETDQKLHYIGIPLNVRYLLVDKHRLGIYVAAGGEVERCVSGRLFTDYIREGLVVASEEEAVCPKRLQWSATLSAGVQFNLFNRVSLYAEPGVSYYFGNGQPLETFYTDKPLKFNLELGLRFSLR